ncbi:ubiquitin conjugation factor E4 A [Trichonephila clavata]|uniref:Ubiquitin conjugation factor E4 A n=1 Tax=Trichonephila clavata TaxID=2740835 RepID=A0A8X6KLJ1_TRICU|nr:ubiquitin conjugation factor E4 A [Trichonephila clavata]
MRILRFIVDTVIYSCSMSDPDYKNPFAALFPCSDENDAFKAGVISSEIIDRPSKSGECGSQESSSSEMQSSNVAVSKAERHNLTHFYEDVFRVTLSREPCCQKYGPASLIFLNEVHVALSYQTEIDEQCIDRAIFERLLIEDPTQHIVRRKPHTDDDEATTEKRLIFYMYQCYYRLKNFTDSKIGPLETAHHIIVSQTASAICNPELFPEAKLCEDLMKLLLHYHDEAGHCEILSQFLVDVTTSVVEISSGPLVEVIRPAFSYLQEKLATASLSDRNLFIYIDILNYFTGSDELIKALLKHSTPNEIKNGKAYQNSLLGLPLGVSCLPKSEFDRYEFFQEPSRYSNHEHAITEERLSVPLITIARNMHSLFEKILRKSSNSRELLLQWIGNCLDANSGRAKIWNSQLPEVYASLHGSDGFFINLLAVLLLLCKPFSEPCSPKLSKVNPLYCAAPLSSETLKNGVHIKSISSETCLLPRDEPMESDETTYNFMTECFFATHYAFRIGFHVVNEKMVKQNQELMRTQRLYEETRLQGGEASEIGQQLKEKMERGMARFLSYRTALLVPETLHLMLKFHIATATWLINLSTNEDLNVYRTSKFPPLNETSCNLSYVPEFILENIIDCTIFLKRFSTKSFELAGDHLDHFMTLILMFMGSPERVKNPHLRAHLAEMLESLMPEDETNTLLSSVYREKLFTTHNFVGEMIPTLLNVFVSIEMTGQSVAFEQKFQYRRPMYVVLDYLWNFDVHKNKMKEMAEIAEQNMESPHPPIFLHFINLLINDAIFLLDEALSYMSKLREIQQARDSGSWNSMSPDQQQQQEGNFHHMGLLAKFHNVMSNETINTLQWLTSEIKSIFCHPTIVDRITAMLNYFLLNLVGPQKKNFKVKDLKEYEFKPHELVRDICKIYQNLGYSDDKYAERFCGAVSRDGRSYTSDLFPLAQAVLIKIGQRVLACQLESIASKVHQLAVKQQQDDELLMGAPEEFLDPIMSTLMNDPVKLPSSGVTVDRATIARHLLSDQTDPFNRSPLTMDMVIPNEELKSKMEIWFHERRSASNT